MAAPETSNVITVITGALGNIIAAGAVAITAFIFRKNIKRFFRSSTLKSHNSSPALSLDISSSRDEKGEWVTHFLLENIGEIEVAKLRVYLCTYASHSNFLSVKRIKIDRERKWINSGGHRLQIDTHSLHEGCNVTQDQRFFVEFIDDSDGTIYRMGRGAPSPKDGSMAFYGTMVCRRRLPRFGLTKKREAVVQKAIKRYDIDIARG